MLHKVQYYLKTPFYWVRAPSAAISCGANLQMMLILLITIFRTIPGIDGLLTNDSQACRNSRNMIRLWGFLRELYLNVKKWKYTSGVNKPARPKNNNITTNGIKKISVKEINLKIFPAWSSTNDMSNLAPHHEFWPRICKMANYITINWYVRVNDITYGNRSRLINYSIIMLDRRQDNTNWIQIAMVR